MVAYIYTRSGNRNVLAVPHRDNIEIAIVDGELEEDDAAAATAAPEELSALLLPASAGLWLCLSAPD